MNENDHRSEFIGSKEMDPQDEPAVLAFYQENLKGFKRFFQLWNWRKTSPSNSIKENILIAVDQNQDIKGCLGLVPVSVTVADRIIKGAWQQDSLVSPQARGRGIGKKLVMKGNDSCSVAFAKGTSQAMYGLRKSMGYMDVPHSNLLIRVCRIRGGHDSILKKVLLFLPGIWATFMPFPRHYTSVRVTEIREFDDSFDELDKTMVKGLTVRPYKGKDYLNCRYTQCPDKNYTVFKAGSKKTLGAIVLSCSGNGCKEGWIVDMICGFNDTSTAYALIYKAVSHFNEQKVSRIWCFATHPEARKWLYGFGFLPTNRSPKFTYFTKDKELQQKLNRCNWDFWHGDGDIELYQ